MKVKPANAYKQWMSYYGNEVPHNIISVYKMILRWNINTLDEITSKLLSDPKLGPVTFNNRLAILKRFCKWCIKKKLTRYDFTDDIPHRKIQDQNSKRQPYTDEQIQLILTALQANYHTRRYYYSYVKFMFLTGVRNGEAAGLKIGNIDFKTGYLLIDKSYSKKTNGKYQLKSTKTLSGIRYLPITEDLKQLLEPLCRKKDPSQYVFRSRYGNPINNINFQKRVFKPLLKKLNIPVRDLYACRHTFGTIAVEQNIDILSIAYLMGHKKPRTVLDHYAKLRNKPKSLPKII